MKRLCRRGFRMAWDGLGCFRLLDVRVFVRAAVEARALNEPIAA